MIGASWAACFLARGLDVVATDPAPGAERALRAVVDDHWRVLERLGTAPDASRERLSFTVDTAEAASRADVIQENGPERLDLKLGLLGLLDSVAPAHVIIASSSSGLMPSEMQAGLERHPERFLVAHPFNPPHLVPLVEIVAGERTDEAVIERALTFYRALGKRPVRLRRELPGHVGSRAVRNLRRPSRRQAHLRPSSWAVASPSPHTSARRRP